jgi:hypothetical protein
MKVVNFPSAKPIIRYCSGLGTGQNLSIEPWRGLKIVAGRGFLGITTNQRNPYASD